MIVQLFYKLYFAYKTKQTVLFCVSGILTTIYHVYSVLCHSATDHYYMQIDGNFQHFVA